MPGESRFDSNLRRLGVTNLTHQHRIRVLSEDAPQGAGKGQPTLGGNLHLIDTLQLILDGVFHRNDIVLDRLHLFKR